MIGWRKAMATNPTPLRFVDVRHDCEPPDDPEFPAYGEDHQVFAKWRCPECRTRWVYAVEFLDHGRFFWHRRSRPSRRWLREARAARLRKRLDQLKPTGMAR